VLKGGCAAALLVSLQQFHNCFQGLNAVLRQVGDNKKLGGVSAVLTE
jgi:hypothetical protein